MKPRTNQPTQKAMKNNKRNYLFLFAALALIVVAVAAQARTERHYRATAAQHINLTVDSIDFRSDLTRVYGKLVGRPHTSQRIDEAIIHIGQASFQARDIDGVDFKRWFQWEEDGNIPVEIDFRQMTPFQSAVIELRTPRGTDRIEISNK